MGLKPDRVSLLDLGLLMVGAANLYAYTHSWALTVAVSCWVAVLYPGTSR